MHDPLGVVLDVKDALALASLERIPLYMKEQRKALLEWFENPDGPLNDPLVEFDPPFVSADLTWDEVVQEKLLLPETLAILRMGDTIKSERPYQHQLEAITRARNGQSLVISAGTGSGKTECFLIPILDDLLREAQIDKKPLLGLRSLLIYPLNALVFDQMGRWRSVLQHQRAVLGFIPIRLAMYNAFLERHRKVGEDLHPVFQALEIDPKDPMLRPYLPLEEGEVQKREEFLVGGQDGANLLITNYVMMELALLREPDQTWLNEAGHWRHVVLDEAHSYTGGLAVDIALLLRRLRDRIQPPKPPQGFATSATFGGKDAQKDLTEFAQILFDQPASDIRILKGQRSTFDFEVSTPMEIADDYHRLVGLLQQRQDPDRLKALVYKWSELNSDLFGENSGDNARLRNLLRVCSEARDKSGKRALLPHRLHAVLRRPIPWSSQCSNPKCIGKIHNHGFQRWPTLGWIGRDPSDDECPHCNSPMLLPVTCRNEGCAQEGLLAMVVFAGFPPKPQSLSYPHDMPPR